MLDPIPCKNNQELEDTQLSTIVEKASEIYKRNGNLPIRILDLATGPNEFNPKLIKKLSEQNIDYELVLSDISPTHMKRGYENLKRELTIEQLNKVKAVIVDSNDLRKKPEQITLYGKTSNDIETLENVLSNPEFDFLSSSYNQLDRKENFDSESFDLVIGNIPYTSMSKYNKAVNESARVLKIKGYQIVRESQVEKINTKIKRTSRAMRGAKIKHIDEITEKLNSKLQPVALFTSEHQHSANYYHDDEIVQNGDLLKDVVFVYKKERKEPNFLMKQLFNLFQFSIYYGAFCVMMTKASCYLGPQITKERAQQIINVESQRESLKNKNISLMLFEDGTLDEQSIGGIAFSSNDTSYVGFDKNDISASRLYHEIGHTIINEPTKEKYSLNEGSQSMNEVPSKQNQRANYADYVNLIKYIYSPEELFCNVFALYSVARDKIKGDK